MAKPNALAIPRRSTAVGPEPMPPTTAAPQPKNTSAKVPINSAICLFIVPPSSPLPKKQPLLSPSAPPWEADAPRFGPLVHDEFPHVPVQGGKKIEMLSGRATG